MEEKEVIIEDDAELPKQVEWYDVLEGWLASRAGWWASLVVLTSLAVALYLPSLDGQYIYDDLPAVSGNKMITSPRIAVSDYWTYDFWGNQLRSEGSNKSWRPVTTLVMRQAHW